MSRHAKYLVAIVLIAAIAGCGGGKSLQSTGNTTANRSDTLTRFDVNVKTGKVIITRPNRSSKSGRAIFTGGAVAFTSSDLLTAGGDSGKRLVHIGVANNSGETMPASMRLIVSNLGNSTDPDLATNNVVVSTFAGSGTQGTTDGYGTSAQFYSPDEVTAGGGPFRNSLFVTETANQVIRKVELDGSVTTFAGTSGLTGWVDGTGTGAKFYNPQQTASDSAGNLFVADYNNHRIRRITPLKQVTTVAGTSSSGNGNGTGDVATFNIPTGIAVSSDGLRIYVADYNNHNIRLLTYNGSGQRDKAASYTVSTVAGSTTGASGFQDGPASGSLFTNPTRLALRTDLTGTETLYLTDKGNNRIRGILDPASGSATVFTVAGTGTAASVDGAGSVAQFWAPYGIAAVSFSDGRFALIVSEATTGNSRIRMVTYVPGSEPTQSGNYKVATLAGSTDSFQDGPGNSALFKHPYGIWAVAAPGPSATVFIADYDNYRLRKLSLSSGNQSGGPGTSVTEPVRLVNWDSEVPNSSPSAWVKNIALSGDDPPYSADLQFYIPNGVSGFSFTAYVEADTNLVNLPAVGSVSLSTLAGNGSPGLANGPGKSSQFNGPNSVVAVPASLRSAYMTYGFPEIRAFMADSSNRLIRYIDVNGTIGIFAGGGTAVGLVDGLGQSARFDTPYGIAVGPDGSLFVTDQGANRRIRRIAPDSTVITIAGSGTVGGNTDGIGNVAVFDKPAGITVDAGGTIFLTDSMQHVVRRIQYIGGDPAAPTSYYVATVAGVAGSSGSNDGPGPSGMSPAKFTAPLGIVCDTDGKIYIADSGSQTVRLATRTSAAELTTTTLAGVALTAGTNDGTGTGAKFSKPASVSKDQAHNLYVVDYDSHRLRRVSIQVSGQGTVTTLIGSTSGFTDGSSGKFNNPVGVAVEETGSIMVVDYVNNALRLVQRVVTDAQAPQQ